MSSFLRCAALAVLMLAGPAATAALAQEGAAPTDEPAKPAADGYVTGYTCGDMPEGLALRAVPQDDSPSQQEIAPMFGEAFQARGYRMDPNAPIRLLYKVDRAQLSESPSGPNFGKFGVDTYADAEVKVNVFSTREDSILGGRRDRAKGAYSTYYTLEAQIDGPPAGAEGNTCIWRGNAVVKLEGRDEQMVAQNAVRALVEAIGETVERRPFNLAQQ